MLRTGAGLQQMGAAAVIGNKAAGDGAAGGRWSSLSGRGPGEPASGEHMVTRAGPRLVEGVGARTGRGAGPWQWLRTVCSWQSGRCIHCDAGPTAPGAFGTRCGLWLVGVSGQCRGRGFVPLIGWPPAYCTVLIPLHTLAMPSKNQARWRAGQCQFSQCFQRPFGKRF